MNKCKFCGKETMRKSYCCDNHRGYVWRREQRKKMKKEHRCIDCGKKLKPVIIYHTRCPIHLKRG